PEVAVRGGVLGVAVLLPGWTWSGLSGRPAAPGHPAGPRGGRARGSNRALPTHTASTWFLRGDRGDKVPPRQRFEVKTLPHTLHAESHGHVSLGLQHRLHRGPVRPLARGPFVGRPELARALLGDPQRGSSPARLRRRSGGADERPRRRQRVGGRSPGSERRE